MGKTLTEIAGQLKNSDKKVQLIYAFNGTGKTRLSREFKELVAPKGIDSEVDHEAALSRKIIYYNAFTEDLFYWDNDLAQDAEHKLKIQPNSFTDWILNEQSDVKIIENFQHYTNKNLIPKFIPKETVYKDKNGRNVKVISYPEVIFTISNTTPENTKESEIKIDENNLVKRGKDRSIKISKGEESSIIWCVFFSLLEIVVEILNNPEPANRQTKQYDQLEYIFIDDPVSSLDENHLIELAVNLAALIKASESEVKFILSTHSPLFHNVLYNELNKPACYLLDRQEDGTFELPEKQGDSNKSFSYHLHLKRTLEEAIERNDIQKYHFTLLRNLYEKTSSFLGYPKWAELLPDDKQVYLTRILNFTSHSTLSNEVIAEPSPQEKQTIKFLLDHLMANYHFWREVEDEK
jgi:wobble nucleotide-excising tRNase